MGERNCEVMAIKFSNLTLRPIVVGPSCNNIVPLLLQH